jgi:hypothetical protein
MRPRSPAWSAASIAQRPLWRCRSAAIERSGGLTLRRPWLALSRALTRVARIALPKVAARRTLDAVRLQLLALSPWQETGFAVERSGDTAVVWYWDDAHLRRLLADAGVAADAVDPLPEAALRDVDDGGGLRLVECLEGFEGQFWKDGQLFASMWWPSLPDEEAWRTFAWDVGARAAAVPRPAASAWRARPASALQVFRAGQAPRQWDAAAAARIAAAALGACAIWLGVQHARVLWELRARSTQLEAVEERGSALREARVQAARDAEAAARLAALRPALSQAELMLELREAAGPQRQPALREWEFRDGRLRVVFDIDPQRFDRGAALDALARATHLREIQLSSGSTPNTVAIVAQVGGTAPATAEARGR